MAKRNIFILVYTLLFFALFSDEIIFRDNEFIVKYTVTCAANPRDALKILYDYKNLKEISGTENLLLLSEKPNEQLVQFVYSFMFMESKMEYTRKISPDNNRIDFEMTNFDRNSDFIPRQIYSKGYYKIDETIETKGTIEYFQKTIFDRSISGFEKYFLKTNTEKQIERIRKLLLFYN